MVSNIALPSTRIGSWTNMFDYFNEREDFFDFILSPGTNQGKFVHCLKRGWPFHSKRLRKFLLINWVARDFVKQICKISSSTDLLKIVVQDDLSLLEAIASLKNNKKISIELIFYFHGFFLQLPKPLDEVVDKVIFLSNMSYRYTLNNNFQFTPESFIVGNFLSESKFSSLNNDDKVNLRKALDIPIDAIVITWMSNDRRVKGLHLFEKLISTLLKSYSDLYFIVIGTNSVHPTISDRIRNVGRVQHDSLPDFLRISDFYFFTSLWMEGFGLSLLEAKYCGNWILTSGNGSIPEVLSKSDHVYFVESPNILTEWVEAFNLAYFDFKSNYPKGSTDRNSFYFYDNWVDRFKSAIG